MPPEKKKTLIDYGKISGMYALALSIWAAGFYVGGEVKTLQAKFNTYDSYEPRIKKLEGFRDKMQEAFSFKPSKNYSQLKTK